MKTVFSVFLLALISATSPTLAKTSRARDAGHPSAAVQTATPAKLSELDSRQMEKDLQRLPWKKFRSIVESIPKLKAGIDAYGPFGWQFVQANYTTYGWKKDIDKLDGNQKRDLAKLIENAKRTR